MFFTVQSFFEILLLVVLSPLDGVPKLNPTCSNTATLYFRVDLLAWADRFPSFSLSASLRALCCDNTHAHHTRCALIWARIQQHGRSSLASYPIYIFGWPLSWYPYDDHFLFTWSVYVFCWLICLIDLLINLDQDHQANPIRSSGSVSGLWDDTW